MKTIPCILPLGLLVGAQTGHGQTQYENVIYPLAYNFVQEEGSAEVWVRPDADLADNRVKSFYHFFAWRTALGKKTWGERGGFALIWRVPQGLYTFGGRKGGSAKLKNTPVIWPRKLIWKVGTWHHLAFTWRDMDMSLYADGELVKRTKASAMMPFDTEGFWVVGFGNSRIAVDEFIVSSIARDPDDIKQRMETSPQEDEFTLISDPMDSLAKTHGRWVQLDARRCKLVDGRFGKAVQLHR